MATTSRRPARRRTTSRRPAARSGRRPARRRRGGGGGGDVLLVVGAVLILLMVVLQWLAAHPAIIVAVLLTVAALVGWRVVRRAEARQRHAQLMADRARIAHYELMSPREFEEALAWLCQRDGCTDVQVVGGAGDLGADVIATTPEGWRLVIQAKRYAVSNRVGSPELQKVGGTARQVHGAQVVAAVTTSGFTRQAWEYAANPRVGIRLFDRDALARWAARTGPAPWH